MYGCRRWSEAECTVRAEAHEIQMIGVWLAVDQHQVRPEVTVPMVLPSPGEGVVAMARCERPVLRQVGYDTGEIGVKSLGEATFSLAPVIPLERRSPPNRPQGGRPSGRRRRRP